MGLEDAEALTFARFLVEEKDEEEPDNSTIELDLKRKVNSQYIPVRLMTNFTKYPTLYGEKEEKLMLQKFEKMFDKETQQKFVKDLNT